MNFRESASGFTILRLMFLYYDNWTWTTVAREGRSHGVGLEQNKHKNLSNVLEMLWKPEKQPGASCVLPKPAEATQLKDLSIPSCCLCSFAAESCPLNLFHGPLQATNINNLNDNQQGRIIKFSKMYQLGYLGWKQLPDKTWLVRCIMHLQRLESYTRSFQSYIIQRKMLGSKVNKMAIRFPISRGSDRISY